MAQAFQNYVDEAGHVSEQVVYASAAGITMDADFADVDAGTDVSADIQAILDTASASAPLTFIIDGVARVKDLKLKGNTTLRGMGWGTGFVQEEGGKSCIRNYNYRSPYLGATIVDENITIRDLQINGNRDNASANTLTTGSWLTNDNYLKANEDGELVHPIKIYGCRGLTIQSVYVRDPACYHVNVANIEGGVFRDLHFNDSANAAAPFNGPNTAGLQVQGPASDLLIDGLYGNTSDDFLALNADDWNQVSPAVPSQLKGAQGWGGGYTAVYKGTIQRVTVRGLHMNSSSGLRVLSSTSLIDEISISAVKGTVTVGLLDTQVLIDGAVGTGNIGRVLLEDVNVTYVDTFGTSVPFVHVAADIKSLTLRNFRFGPLAHGTFNGITIHANTVDQLVVDGVQINEAGGTAPSCNLVTQNGGTAKQVSISNVRWYRGSLSTASRGVFGQTGGTCVNLSLSNIHADRITWLAVCTGGTCPSITSAGVTHTNSDGNASYVATGATVPRLRAAASNTALLTATGTAGFFTSVKTDATEDA